MRTGAFVLTLFAVVALLGGMAMAQEPMRIITLPAVQARGTPSATAASVAAVPLGTVAVVRERSGKQEQVGNLRDYWYRLALPKGREGWVFGAFTRPFDERRADRVREDIMKTRLRDTKTHAEAVELLDFATSSIPRARTMDATAAFELYRLEALEKAVEAIPVGPEGHKRQQAFLDRYKSEIVFNEPAGRYLVKAECFWTLRSKYAKLPIADRLAWTAACQALPGECEGDPACLVDLERRTHGRYLEVCPSGTHATLALKRLADRLRLVAKMGRDIPREEHKDLRTSLGHLRRVVLACPSPARSAALTQIDAILVIVRK